MPSARLARIDVRAIPAHHSRRSLGLLSAISIARSMAGSAIFLISSIRSRERRVVAAVAPLARRSFEAHGAGRSGRTPLRGAAYLSSLSFATR